MKKERTLFLIVLFAACSAIAQQQTNTNAITSATHTNAPSTSTTFPTVKPTFHWFGPAGPVHTGDHPRYVEGLDTRAWTTVVEDGSGQRVFPDAGTHQPGLSLLWWGSESGPK